MTPKLQRLHDAVQRILGVAPVERLGEITVEVKAADYLSGAHQLRDHPELRGRPLYLSALNVGRDHIGSLINTLALAYFGGALPLVLLLSMGFQPLSVSLNSEAMVESIVTVIVASVGLVLCVPVTTAVAVMLAGRREP